MYNTRNGGFLGEALKNYREQHKKKTTNNCENSNVAEENINAVDDGVNLQEVEILKALMITQCNMDEIKTKLTSTRAFRRQMLSAPEVDLREKFPYFFVCPQLVIYANYFSSKFRTNPIAPTSFEMIY